MPDLAMPRVLYVAHPVGHEPERARNLERVRRWWHWLIRQYPDASVQIPWMVYVEELDESPENRTRGIRDDLAALLRCDAIVLVGGNLSPGMQAELEVAKQAGLKVIDLLELGEEPPEVRA